jgi:hypothetical protein
VGGRCLLSGAALWPYTVPASGWRSAERTPGPKQRTPPQAHAKPHNQRDHTDHISACVHTVSFVRSSQHLPASSVIITNLQQNSQQNRGIVPQSTNNRHINETVAQAWFKNDIRTLWVLYIPINEGIDRGKQYLLVHTTIVQYLEGLYIVSHAL